MSRHEETRHATCRFQVSRREVLPRRGEALCRGAGLCRRVEWNAGHVLLKRDRCRACWRGVKQHGSAAARREVSLGVSVDVVACGAVQHALGAWATRTFSCLGLDWARPNSKLSSVFSCMPPHRKPDHQAPTQATVVAQFRDYHAEKFSGQGDPRIVDEWIQGLEFIFEVMECPDRYRVVCAQLQLTGDARLWWNAYWSMRPGEKAGCTWDMFKELVRDKYYPSYYRAEMERQFLALQQGTRTVNEYEREFTRLAAFASDLVRMEGQRAQRFIDGLFPAVRHNIVGHGTQTYARDVSIAQEVDASIRREAVRDRAQPSAPVQPFAAPPALPAPQSAKEKKRKGKGAQTDRRTRQRQQPIPPCPTCGRLHRGECH
ncbi:Unknown protein, partial [Striga hermonthica]